MMGRGVLQAAKERGGEECTACNRGKDGGGNRVEYCTSQGGHIHVGTWGEGGGVHKSCADPIKMGA